MPSCGQMTTTLTAAPKAETVASMHGDAERVPLDGVAEAVQVFFEALRDTLAR